MTLDGPREFGKAGEPCRGHSGRRYYCCTLGKKAGYHEGVSDEWGGCGMHAARIIIELLAFIVIAVFVWKLFFRKS